MQADLKTFAALSVHGVSVIAALTAQDSRGVAEWEPVRPALLAKSLDLLLADFPVAAAKTGLLGSAAAVELVASRFAGRALPLVVDPVLASSSGASFADAATLAAYRSRLLPVAALVTPNLAEASALSGVTVDPGDRKSWLAAAQAIHALGARAVLVKGGHAGGSKSEDLLWDGVEATTISGPRIEGKPLHGTGCALSAAITAALARGKPLFGAIRQARRFLEGALAAAGALGKGPRGPMHHLHPFYPWSTSREERPS